MRALRNSTRGISHPKIHQPAITVRRERRAPVHSDRGETAATERRSNMGMDVIGMNPIAPEGEYFRATIWAWDPIAAFVETVAPEEAKPCTHWHYNDGDGLDAAQSVRLADRLQEAVATGAINECLNEIQSYPDRDQIAGAERGSARVHSLPTRLRRI